MPLLENDVIFAYLDEYDHKHDVADQIFQKLHEGEIEVEISSVSLMEMELIYRSNQIEDVLLKHLTAITALHNVHCPDGPLSRIFPKEHASEIN